MSRNLHSMLPFSSFFTLLPRLMPQVSGAPALCKPCGPAQGLSPLAWGGRVLAGRGAGCTPHFLGWSRLSRVLPSRMVLLTARFL